jgi:hypothetical protein
VTTFLSSNLTCPATQSVSRKCAARHAQSGARLGSLRIERETFEPQLAGRAAALPALSRIASAQAYPTQSAVVGSKRVVDGLNVPGSIPVLPCVHKQHTASIAWMLGCHQRATCGVVAVGGWNRPAFMVAVAIFSTDPVLRRNLEQLPHGRLGRCPRGNCRPSVIRPEATQPGSR